MHTLFSDTRIFQAGTTQLPNWNNARQTFIPRLIS